MAWVPTTVEDIEYVANALSTAGEKLKRVADAMRKSKMPTMQLQLTMAQGYAEACRKLSNDAEMHLENQIHCMNTGSVPLWQKRVQKAAYNKALRESKTSVEPENLVKPAKKAAKKKGA